MKKKLIALLGLVLFCNHDMYLKMDTYFLEPDQQANIHLYNGTFEKSENVIDRDRMLKASLTGNGNSYQITEDQWSEKDSITVLSFKTRDSGTWVAGVSTKPRTIEMKAEDFNDYLKHDGVLDMLEWRSENDELKEDAVEKYAKHVKAIFQVGDKTSADWKTALGYPIEFVPLENPYEKHTGDELQVKLLLRGKPLADQLVYADYTASEHGHTHDGGEQGHAHETGEEEHTHGEGEDGHSHQSADGDNHAHSHAAGEEHSHSPETADGDNHAHSHANGEEHVHEEDHKNEPEDNDDSDDHQHTSGQELRTDQNGMLTVKLSADGIWYLRTIHLTKTNEPGLTHESNWATLTFETVHGHEHEEGAEGHVHAEEEEFPSYVFWIGSLVVLGGLFFWFSRKK